MSTNRVRDLIINLRNTFEDEAAKDEQANRFKSLSEDEINANGALLLTKHIIDCVASLRDFAKEGSFLLGSYGSSESILTDASLALHSKQVPSHSKELAGKTISAELLNGFQSEIAKLLIMTVTREWDTSSFQVNTDEEIALKAMSSTYLSTSEHILRKFPEMAIRKHKVTAKMLIHHVCHRAIPPDGERLLATVLDCCVGGASSLDTNGATPMHWLMKNRKATIDMVNILLKGNPSALQATDVDGRSPLHWAFDNDYPNIPLIERVVELYPDTIQRVCDKGWLPIHDLVNREVPSIQLLKLLLRALPASINATSRSGATPLHVHVDRNQPESESVRILIDSSPGCLAKPNMSGHLPLHLLADQSNPSLVSLKLLMERYPAATNATDVNGFIPLHLALHRAQPLLGAVVLLIEFNPQSAAAVSRRGLYPLHLLVGMNSQPSLALAKLLVSHCRQAIGAVVDVKLNANDMDASWTPLTRALERHLTDISQFFFEATKNHVEVEEKPIVLSAPGVIHAVAHDNTFSIHHDKINNGRKLNYTLATRRGVNAVSVGGGSGFTEKTRPLPQAPLPPLMVLASSKLPHRNKSRESYSRGKTPLHERRVSSPIHMETTQSLSVLKAPYPDQPREDLKSHGRKQQPRYLMASSEDDFVPRPLSESFKSRRNHFQRENLVVPSEVKTEPVKKKYVYDFNGKRVLADSLPAYEPETTRSDTKLSDSAEVEKVAVNISNAYESKPSGMPTNPSSSPPASSITKRVISSATKKAHDQLIASKNGNGAITTTQGKKTAKKKVKSIEKNEIVAESDEPIVSKEEL